MLRFSLDTRIHEISGGASRARARSRDAACLAKIARELRQELLEHLVGVGAQHTIMKPSCGDLGGERPGQHWDVALLI